METLISTSWHVTKIRTGAFEVSTGISLDSEKGHEQIDVRVIVDGADRMTGEETHRAALVRARAVIDGALR